MVASSDQRRRSVEGPYLATIEVKPGDRVAIHLGENPSQEFIEASKRAVEEAWGDEVNVLFVMGSVGITVIRSIEAEI